MGWRTVSEHSGIISDLQKGLKGEQPTGSAKRWIRARRLGGSVGWVVAIGIALIASSAQSRGYLVQAAYRYHMLSDEFVIPVYGSNWQSDEFRNCTTLNNSSTKQPINLLCDDGEPSRRIQDGENFKVRFYGRTYDETRPVLSQNGPDVAGALFWWRCRRTEGANPYIICEQSQSPYKMAGY